MSLVFLLLLQTLVHQSSSIFNLQKAPQPSADKFEFFDSDFVFDHWTYYDGFVDKLFPNYRSNVCHPYNSTVAQITKDKNVIQVHSHNDYWRAIPVFDALSYGFNSIESDVWLVEGTLLVGHNSLYLASSRTVKSLYLEPLKKLLDEVNCMEKSSAKHGLFYNEPETTTYLYIDIKTEALATYKQFVQDVIDTKLLEYLTYYDFETNKVVQGPISIIITGDSPNDFIIHEQLNDPFSINRRIGFIDAPLSDLLGYNDSISLVSSGSLGQLIGPVTVRDGITFDQRLSLNKNVRKAHSLNLKTRLWDTPNWPKLKRNKVWAQLIDLGVDYINADDLLDARNF